MLAVVPIQPEDWHLTELVVQAQKCLLQREGHGQEEHLRLEHSPLQVDKDQEDCDQEKQLQIPSWHEM